jgi:hypothetical protein
VIAIALACVGYLVTGRGGGGISLLIVTDIRNLVQMKILILNNGLFVCTYSDTAANEDN